MGKRKPKIVRPISNEEIITLLTNEENLADMAWSFHDWVEAADWLSKMGAPEYTEEGNWNPMVERIKWVMKNVEPV